MRFALAHVVHRTSFAHLLDPALGFLEVTVGLQIPVNSGLGYTFCPCQSPVGLKSTEAASVLNRPLDPAKRGVRRAGFDISLCHQPAVSPQ